jgi:hypothetical protein
MHAHVLLTDKPLGKKSFDERGDIAGFLVVLSGV